MGEKLAALRKIRSIADYQFGKGVGEKLFPDEVEIIHSKRTEQVKYVMSFSIKKFSQHCDPPTVFSL